LKFMLFVRWKIMNNEKGHNGINFTRHFRRGS
jgi:hypothetical protein